MKMTSGANAPITKENPNLATVVASFDWKNSSSSNEFVASAIICGDNKKALSPSSLVFFNQTLTDDETVELVQNGNKEQIEVDIAFVPENIHRIVFIVYANPEERGTASFATMSDAQISIETLEGKSLLNFDIPSEVMKSNTSAVIFGELYRYKGDWKFRAIGQGYSTLQKIADDFGVDL